METIYALDDTGYKRNIIQDIISVCLCTCTLCFNVCIFTHYSEYEIIGIGIEKQGNLFILIKCSLFF